MVQVPTALPVMVVPLIVHIVGVLEVNVTSRFEVAVALTVAVPSTDRVLGVGLIAPMV